jgi:flagellar assembly factor FliW
MRLQGTRFGTVDFTAEDIVSFDQGLIGFPSFVHFVLVCPKPGSQFRWLQSLEDPALAFLLMDPATVFPNYGPELPDADAQALQLTEKTPRLVYVTVSIPRGKPQDMTVNLLAPIVLNAESRTGKQVILGDDAYTIKHRVLQAEGKEAETIAA